MKKRSSIRIIDLLSESLAGIAGRPARTALTVFGTILGIGALVATLGIAQTAGNQIVGRFDELAATSVSVENASAGFFRGPSSVSVIPRDAEARLTRLNGVVAAGSLSSVDTEGAFVRSVPINDPRGRSEFQIRMFGASPGLFEAIVTELGTGRLFDEGHDERSDLVAVLGPAAANRLNINRVDQLPAIFIGDQELSVIGILDDVAREPGLLDAIIIPQGTAIDHFGLDGIEEVHIRTDLGAAQLIGSQAAVALSPNNSELLDVRVPPEPGAVRADVEADVNSLFLILGGISLLVGALGIANVTLVSVLERTGEIGLRRALGAGRRHIASQFLLESAAMGTLGGVVGSTLGVLVVVGVSASRTWTPVMDSWIPLAAPGAGLAVGVIAGLYPAWRASSIEPVEALRSG